jgi:hypothetical protein
MLVARILNGTHFYRSFYRNLPGGKKRPARMADNLTAICESIV